ncbi:hypothetical protein PAL_GLEAN10004467 [Pteropus alecto]|uniref:Uncharacterized protein n=1 Tax=Pteropus alecto TaxID=9402 RepID=L5L4B4_PTEAL|nr:hypothetical protein PAL_GLEAN10004467 [Pteropus alecto]
MSTRWEDWSCMVGEAPEFLALLAERRRKWGCEWAAAEEGGRQLELNVTELHVGLSIVSLEERTGCELQIPGSVMCRRACVSRCPVLAPTRWMDGITQAHSTSSGSWKGPTYNRIFR